MLGGAVCLGAAVLGDCGAGSKGRLRVGPQQDEATSARGVPVALRRVSARGANADKPSCQREWARG